MSTYRSSQGCSSRRCAVDNSTEETVEEVEEFEETAVTDNAESEEVKPKQKKSRKPWEAFKNFAIVFSFIVNFVLILVLLFVAPLIIPIVADIAVPIVGGLNESFVDMEKASILQTIRVSDTIPISFILPLRETTVVTLTDSVILGSVPTQFSLPGGGGAIYGAVTLSLPAGLALPVALNVDVPVDQIVPVQLDVNVDIPLNQTELGKPFNQLKDLFGPIDGLLRDLPSSNSELGDRVKSAITGSSTEEVPPTE